MIAFWDKYYFKCSGEKYKKSFGIKLSCFFIRICANIYAKWLMPVNVKNKDIDANTVLCSLTSFPARINDVWMTIATLLNSDYENMRVILWLSKNQFSGINSLPHKLRILENKGLLIKFLDDDLRSHKKYYGCLTQYPNNTFITFDDDVLYHPSLVGRLMNIHSKYPHSIICNRAMKIIKDTNYRFWGQYRPKNQQKALSESLQLNLLPTGVGGVLYPKGCFEGTKVLDVDLIKKTTFNTDDLWLNFWARYANIEILHSGYRYGLITLLGSQQYSLTSLNVAKEQGADNRNDIEKDKLDKWAKEFLGCGFFINVIK